MAFTKSTTDLNIIAALDDQPNDEGGLTAAAFKAKFDEAALTLQTDLNAHIDEVAAATGAANVGFAPTAGVNKPNVQEAIEDVQAQLAGVVLGEITDGTITEAKMADEMKKDIEGGVAGYDALQAYSAIKFYGKYSQMSGGAAMGNGTANYVTFSTEDNDDFSAINLATSTSRITIPAGVSTAQFYLYCRAIMDGTYGIPKLYKNGVYVCDLIYGNDIGETDTTKKHIEVGGTFETYPMSVAENDYFQIYTQTVAYNATFGIPPRGAISAGAVFGFHVLG